MKFKFTLSLSIFALVTVGAIPIALYWQSSQTLREHAKILKRATIKDFHDPESARFRSLQLLSPEDTVVERLRQALSRDLFPPIDYAKHILSAFDFSLDDVALCGEVNAKNAFGAYVGYRHFFALRQGDKLIIDIDREENTYKLAKRLCDLSDGKLKVILSEEQIK